ncbi:NlpC/P60 family protein [Candidatus Neomarinimicrobiota bacterium]
MSKYTPDLLLRLLALISLLVLTACQPSVPAELQQLVADVHSQFAPDTRVAIFDIALTIDGGSLIVSGEVDRAEFRDVLLARLASTGIRVDDQIVVLSEALPDSTTYGIVRISVAHMRSRPSALADLVNQPILGDVVRLLKFDGEYYLVQNWDGYIGWIRGGSLAVTDLAGAERWQSGNRVVHTANYGVIRAEPTGISPILVDLVAGARLKYLNRKANWTKVELPDGKLGYVAGSNLVDQSGVRQGDASEIIATAQKFRGVPYLWGGTSTKGFDCSGFTQTVFRLNGIELPRDASQQALVGQPLSLDDNFAHLIPGDLLFFGSTPERITHEAIYIGGLGFIHSGGENGQVAVNSLDPESDLFSQHRLETLRLARRIVAD